MSIEGRRAALQLRIDHYVRRGFRAVSQTDTTARLVRPKRFSLLWFLLSVLTVIGWPFYLFYHLFLKREAQVYLAVDETGKVHATQRRR